MDRRRVGTAHRSNLSIVIPQTALSVLEKTLEQL